MARRRKNRTHLKGVNSAATQDANSAPKTFIVKHGQVGSSLAQLVRDVRKTMEPNTASRLRERSRNKLKDYLTMAPVLRVTHLLAFALTPVAPSLRLVKLSAGPTLCFRVERYSLVKDMIRVSRRTRGVGMEYLSPPLLVLASFPPPSPTTPPHLTLLAKSFQTLFPPLSLKTLALSSARRVVLVSYNASTGTVDWRHYLITVKPHGVSKGVRRVVEGGVKKGKGRGASRSKDVPDLGGEMDIADFVLRKKGGVGVVDYESGASSTEDEEEGEEGAAVSLAEDYVGRNNKKGQKKAVRLDEIGPRMELRLIKITEGVPGKEGAVLYHEFVKKTKKEAAALKAAHAAKEKLRRERREEQERNVKRKETTAKEDAKEASSNTSQDEEDVDEDGWDEEAEWDGEEEVSDGEGSLESGSEESEDEDQRPSKKTRLKPQEHSSRTKTKERKRVPA